LFDKINEIWRTSFSLLCCITFVDRCDYRSKTRERISMEIEAANPLANWEKI
jgi:hypothetical protein